MDALDILIEQHRLVDNLFSLVTEYNKAVEQEIIEHLINHSAIEEVVFYPALMQREETKDLAEHALKEHEELKKLLKKWQETEEDEWVDTAKKIVKSVRHHVEEEEGEMFPKVREVFSKQELIALGSKMAV